MRKCTNVQGAFWSLLLRKVRSVFMDTTQSGMSKFTQNEDFFCFVKAEYEFWTTVLLQTAPGHSDFKDVFSQPLFWDLSKGVLWDSDLDSSLAISELSSALFVTFSAFWSVFRVIVLLEDPWPLVETQLSDTGDYVAPRNSLVIIRFHDTVHTVKATSARSSKAIPKYLWTSSMFDWRDCVFFLWRSFFFFCKQCHDVLYQKALLLSHPSTLCSPRKIVVLSHKFWKTPVLLFYAFVSAVVSSWFSYHSVPFHSDGDG